jgi:hypothetical protein
MIPGAPGLGHVNRSLKVHRPMRYGKQLLAARGGMTRAAQAQGREERDREAP